MKKIMGYLSAGLGLLLMAGNSTVGREAFPVIANIDKNFILIPGLVLIVLGVVIMIITGDSRGDRKGIKQSENEVPIYQGEGKKRRIVGYKAEK